MINPKPVTTYTAPALPTLRDVREDSAFLKQIPLRWKRKAGAFAAAAGIIIGLTGCSACDEFRTHYGGAGVALYVVYLTEQEAYDIIENHLWKKGFINDNDDGTEHSDFPHYDVFIDNVQKLAVLHFQNAEKEEAEETARAFADEHEVSAGVVYSERGGGPYNDWSWFIIHNDEEFHSEPLDSQTPEAMSKEALEERLIERLKEFSDTLKEKGILEA
jgi:hypothetical protein